MKILNRPMFRMGGPIKEGIMNGIKEPRQGYQQSGMVFPRDIKRMMPNAAKVFSDVENQYTNTFAGDKINYNPYINKNKTDGKEFLRYEGKEPIFKESIDINNDGVVTMKEKYMDSYENQKRISDLTNKKNRELIEPFLAEPNTTDKFLPSRQGDYLNPDYINPSEVVESYDGSTDKMPPMLDKTGKTGAGTIDEVIKEKDTVIDTEGNRKKSINNILEKLGYARSQKNALYDALIKGGQRISREGLGKEGLVNDLIMDTSTSYDKPEKIREAAELMQVQQDLKLEGIRESKVNKMEDDISVLMVQGKMSRQEALDTYLKNPTTSNEAFEIWNDKSKDPAAAVRVGVEYAVKRGEFKKPIGVIDPKKYEEGKDFLKTNPEAGNYIFNGRIINISDTGKATTIKTFYRKRKEDTWLGSLFGSKEEIIG